MRPVQPQAAALPLVIDLEKALLAGAAFSFAASHPDYAGLPYRHDVIAQARQAHDEGRPVYLITQYDETYALGVALHLGVFRGVIASTDRRSLADRTKIDVLVHEFGRNGFAYVGGVGSDALASANPHSADAQDGEAASVGSPLDVNGPVPQAGAAAFGLFGAVKIWANALRLHQWSKNILVFVPLLTSHQFSPANIGYAALAFLAFSLCASAAYLLNDVIDLEADRAHPSKRLRAIASGRLSTTAALTAIPLLAIGAFSAAFAVSPAFAVVLLGYAIVTAGYSLYLKRRLMLDIVALAILYTIRIVGGAVAIDVILSEWLLIFSIFVFTSLALIKRYAELAMRKAAQLPDATNRDYRIDDMTIVGALAAAAGMNAITVVSLYLSSPAVSTLYHRPGLLWLLDPLLIYWIARALLMAHRQQMHDDPIVFAFSDRPSQITAALMIATVIAAI